MNQGTEVTYDPAARAQYLAFLEANFSKQGMAQLFKSKRNQVNNALANANRKYLNDPNAVQVGKPLILGILAVDEAFHMGMIMKISGTVSSAHTVGAVSSTTLVKGVGVWVHHYHQYEGETTITDLLEKSQAYISHLDAINR